MTVLTMTVLTLITLSLIGCIFCTVFAFYYRNRGRAQAAVGDTQNRIISWALPVGIVCSFIAGLYQLHPYWFLLSFPLAFTSVCIGHASFQSPGLRQYITMALYGAMIVGAPMLPFLIFPDMRPLVAVSVSIGLLAGVVSWLSYTPLFQTHTLIAFGIVWCAPGDSTWEEWLQGCVYGAAYFYPVAVALCYPINYALTSLRSVL